VSTTTSTLPESPSMRSPIGSTRPSSRRPDISVWCGSTWDGLNTAHCPLASWRAARRAARGAHKEQWSDPSLGPTAVRSSTRRSAGLLLAVGVGLDGGQLRQRVGHLAGPARRQALVHQAGPLVASYSARPSSLKMRTARSTSLICLPLKTFAYLQDHLWGRTGAAAVFAPTFISSRIQRSEQLVTRRNQRI
jgi:hypothetical protein